jgi:hypothetical protein
MSDWTGRLYYTHRAPRSRKMSRTAGYNRTTRRHIASQMMNEYSSTANRRDFPSTEGIRVLVISLQLQYAGTQ